MFYKTPFPSLLSFILLMIGCVLFTMSTLYTIYRVQNSGKCSCTTCLNYSRLVIGCGVGTTFIFGICSVLIASVLSGNTRKTYFWGSRKNLCARILNGFVLLITFLLTVSWLGVACLTFIPLYTLLYVYFVVCSNRYATSGGSFVNILNEINQHAHRAEDKPAAFKLGDICHPSLRLEDQFQTGVSIIDVELKPSYRDYLHLSIVTTASCILIIISLIFLMIAQGANHAHIYDDKSRYEVAQNADQEIEETKM